MPSVADHVRVVVWHKSLFELDSILVYDVLRYLVLLSCFAVAFRRETLREFDGNANQNAKFHKFDRFSCAQEFWKIEALMN